MAILTSFLVCINTSALNRTSERRILPDVIFAASTTGSQKDSNEVSLHINCSNDNMFSDQIIGTDEQGLKETLASRVIRLLFFVSDSRKRYC